jgi:hypothetical protein
LLEGFDLGAMDPVGPEFVHTVDEAMKLAFADREAFYGDPDFVDVPMETLLSPAYAEARRALIGERAGLEFRPGSPDGRAPRTDYAAAVRRAEEVAMAAGTGEPTVSRLGASGGDTCHVDVIDRWGNMVSATPSAGWLQSSPAIPELGFCLGSRCQMFWLDEELPNGLKPGKRPRTTLSPSMVLRDDGRPWMSFGTPGGEQQDQWQPIMLARMVDHRFTIQQAIDLPAFHSEHWISSFWPRGAKPGKLVLEGRFAPAVLADCKRAGHRAEMGGEWSEGRSPARGGKRTGRSSPAPIRAGCRATRWGVEGGGAAGPPSVAGPGRRRRRLPAREVPAGGRHGAAAEPAGVQAARQPARAAAAEPLLVPVLGRVDALAAPSRGSADAALAAAHRLESGRRRLGLGRARARRTGPAGVRRRRVRPPRHHGRRGGGRPASLALRNR